MPGQYFSVCRSGFTASRYCSAHFVELCGTALLHSDVSKAELTSGLEEI